MSWHKFKNSHGNKQTTAVEVLWERRQPSPKRPRKMVFILVNAQELKISPSSQQVHNLIESAHVCRWDLHTPGSKMPVYSFKLSPLLGLPQYSWSLNVRVPRTHSQTFSFFLLSFPERVPGCRYCLQLKSQIYISSPVFSLDFKFYMSRFLLDIFT